jgi:hypothetical protein
MEINIQMQMTYFVKLVIILAGFANSCCAEELIKAKEIDAAIRNIGQSDAAIALKGVAALEKLNVADLILVAKQVKNDNPACANLSEPLAKRDPQNGEVIGVRQTTVGDVVLGVIRDRIEGHWAKYYKGYSCIDKNNAQEWLQARADKNLLELRIEAAEMALKKVKDIYPNPKTDEEAKIVALYEERLKIIKNGGSPDIGVP